MKETVCETLDSAAVSHSPRAEPDTGMNIAGHTFVGWTSAGLESANVCYRPKAVIRTIVK